MMTITYVPQHFNMRSIKQKHNFIDKYNFGQLIVASVEGLYITHLPFHLNRTLSTSGSLLCHVAKANPIWKNINKAKIAAVFTGPHAYISPRWYSSENQVPTWNYSAVYIEGHAKILDSKDLTTLLYQLTEKEETLVPNPVKWVPTEVKHDKYISMSKAIVGIEIEIINITGKLKMSQNRLPKDRQGAIAGLLKTEFPSSLEVASMIEDANE
jgi:transcriptional regulator